MHLALETADAAQPVGWFAPNYKYLLEVWQELTRVLRPVATKFNATERRIELNNAGVVECWTLDGTDDPGRSRKYKRAIVDEAAIASNLKVVWETSIRPTLTDLQGDAWFLSTPKGLNFFYDLFRRGQDPLAYPDWRSWQLPSSVNPYLPKNEIEAARIFRRRNAQPQDWQSVVECGKWNPTNHTETLYSQERNLKNMGSSKPKVMQTPFKQDTQQTQQQANTFAPFSIRGTQEADEFLKAPLDFGDYGGLSTDIDVDPGVGRRTDLAEEAAMNKWISAFNAVVPRFIREAQRDSEIRKIRSQGAYERQQAEYARQMGKRDLEFRKAGLMGGSARDRTLAELQRRQTLLPQFFQTGGSSTGTGSTSGFNSQVVQPQPGFWQRLLLAGVSGGSQIAGGYLAGR